MKDERMSLYYDLLKEKSRENKNNVKISLETLKEIYIKVFRADYHQPVSDWSGLYPTLKKLEEERKIKLPVGNNSYISYQRTQFPKYIILVKEEKKKFEEPWKSYKWHPKLSWIPSINKMRAITFKRLIKIHEFLQTQPPNILPISEKERSLQVFGDEKELVKLASSPSIRKFSETKIYELIACYPTFEPLNGFRFKDSNSLRILFVENRDTFLSISKVCYVLDDPPFKCVYYGQGLNFKTSVLSIPYEIETDVHIEYFGDIDTTGFLIPLKAKQKLEKIGFEYNISLSKRLYNRLIDLHIEGEYHFPCKDKRKLSKTLDLSFFSLERENYIRDLLNKNERIPQELLNLGEIYRLYSNDPFPEELFLSHRDMLDRLYE